MNAKTTKQRPPADPPDEQGELDKTAMQGSDAQNAQTGSPPTDEGEGFQREPDPAPEPQPQTDQPAPEPAPEPEPPAEEPPADTPPEVRDADEVDLSQEAASPQDVPVDDPEQGGFVRQATPEEIEQSVHQGDVVEKPEAEPDSPEVVALKADERQPAEKETGPEPIDRATLDIAVQQPAEHIGELKDAMPSKESLAELDEVDSARAAALRRQGDWVADSKKFFKGPTEDEIERAANIVEMDRLANIERQRVETEAAEKARKEELEGREERLKELQAKMEDLRSQAIAVDAEIRRLEDLT